MELKKLRLARSKGRLIAIEMYDNGTEKEVSIRKGTVDYEIKQA